MYYGICSRTKGTSAYPGELLIPPKLWAKEFASFLFGSLSNNSDGQSGVRIIGQWCSRPGSSHTGLGPVPREEWGPARLSPAGGKNWRRRRREGGGTRRVLKGRAEANLGPVVSSTNELLNLGAGSVVGRMRPPTPFSACSAAPWGRACPLEPDSLLRT